jgi:hypothetical protein
MTDARVTRNILEVLIDNDPDLRVTRNLLEVVADYDPDVRATRATLEVLADNDPDVRATRATLEVLADNDPDVRTSRVTLEVLHSLTESIPEPGNHNVSFSTKQIVYNSGGTRPYVGFEHLEDTAPGWLWNIKRWCSLFDLKLPSLPRLADPSSQGLDESEYFLSGVGSKDAGDLYIDSINEFFRNNERHWIPSIRHGRYYRYKTPFFLYSDNSRIQYLDSTENRDGRNYIELDAEPDMNSPITAATYIRDLTTHTPYYYSEIQQRAVFSGIFVNGEEQETVSDIGKITWSNVDTTKREFIIDNTIEGVTALKFNRDFIESHGSVPTIYQDLSFLEQLGSSTGAKYQVFYLKYFPVLADNSFHLYVVNSTTWTEWTRVDSWFDLLNQPYAGGNQYFLDKDLGIIYFGSATEGGVPPLGTSIMVTYNSTVRIEYEEIDLENHVIAWDADTSPVTQHINQGFVVITHDQLEPQTITLSIDKAAIPFTTDPVEHGPITVGSDYAVLRATVKGAEGAAIPGTEVSFSLDPSDVGALSGGSDTASVTNGQGEALISYQPPVSADTLGFYSSVVRASTHASYPNHKDIIINEGNSGLVDKEEEVYLYQILKDDILLGYNSLDDFIYDTLETPSWVVDATTYAQWKSELVSQYEIKDWEDTNMEDPTTPPFKALSGRKVVIYKTSPTTNNHDANAIYPVTGALGAIVPVRPELVEKITDVGDPYLGMTRLIYPEDAVPDCDPDDANNNVGGYWIISSRLVKFQASCWSSYYNRVILSNEVVARVSLPPYLLGVYVNDLTQQVPFGWKFMTDTDNIAAGFNGATFITVNPHSGPYNVLDLVNNTSSDDWADAPFKSIGLQFEIQ